jgi:diguanylate cyclase (GGDEF)-like protein/PAS domain S-box-containing protein
MSEAYSRFRYRLVISLLTIASLVMGVVAWKINASYIDAQNAARAQTQTFVHAVEAHVSHSMRLADLSLMGFAHAIKAASATDALSTDAIQKLLSSHGTEMKADFWILFLDAFGVGVGATSNIPVQGAAHADRDYFRVHLTPNTGVFVSPPFIGRTSKQRIFALSRRVETPDGKFIGVVAAVMDAAHFGSVFFENARFNEDVSITLAHRSGKVVARSPFFEQSFGTDASGTDLFQNFRKSSVGTYRATSLVDRQSRIYSYRALDHWPLIVSVGISSQAWDKALVKDTAIGAAGVLLMAIVMLLSGRFALKSFARVEQSESIYRRLYSQIRDAEQKLSNSENFLRTITDRMPAWIAYRDADRRYRFANAHYETHFGVRPADMIGRTITEVFDPTVHADMEQSYAQALQGHEVRFEKTLQGDRGPQYRFVHLVPDIAADGTVMGFYSLITDITERKQAELNQAMTEQRLRAAADTLPVLIGHFDKEERFLYLNSRMAAFFGKKLEDLPGKTLRETYSEELYTQAAPYLKAVLAGERATFESEFTANGTRFHYQVTYLPDWNTDGTVKGFYAMALDITERKNSELRQAKSEARLRTLTDNLPVLISYVDKDQRFRFSNAKYEEWYGTSPVDMIGKTVSEISDPEGYSTRQQALERALGGETVQFEMEIRVKDGVKSVAKVYVPHKNADGTVEGIYTLTSDITALKAVERQLTLLARQDTLTGLPNRLSFQEKLAEAAARCGRIGQSMALMFLDVDKFKAINDTYGHASGDDVLKEFANRLNSAVRATDTVARLAGDEFVIILEGLHTPEEAKVVAQKIIAGVEAPFSVQGQSLSVTTSIGIAVYQHGNRELSRLSIEADEALYQAKAAGRNGYALYGDL